jgi:hypothetical protein
MICLVPTFERLAKGWIISFRLFLEICLNPYDIVYKRLWGRIFEE